MRALFFDRQVSVSDLHHVPSTQNTHISRLSNEMRIRNVHVIVGEEVDGIQVLGIERDDRLDVVPIWRRVSRHAPGMTLRSQSLSSAGRTSTRGRTYHFRTPVPDVRRSPDAEVQLYGMRGLRCESTPGHRLCA